LNKKSFSYVLLIRIY